MSNIWHTSSLFCSVECNADYAERLVDMRTPLDERKQIVAWLRKLDESVYSIQPRWLAKAIERGEHWGLGTDF